MDTYSLHQAELKDVPVMARHRVQMFQDMGVLVEKERSQLLEAGALWLEEQMRQGTYVGWLVKHEGQIAGSGGIHLRQTGPVPGCPRVGLGGHIMNVYTEPAYRRLGVARRIINTILQWCSENQVDHITLTASEEGRPLYESLGFVPGLEMKRGLDCR
jgi:GNAT superfamily N-acetyltransferase